jgi:hypothetical protein
MVSMLGVNTPAKVPNPPRVSTRPAAVFGSVSTAAIIGRC